MDKLKHQDNSILSQGYGIIPKRVMKLPISSEAKAIYAYMCSYAGSGNTAFPGVDRMMKDLKMGRKRFYDSRKELVENQLITVEMTRDGKRRGNNIYTINHIVNFNKILQQCQNETVVNETVQSETVQNDTTNNNSSFNNNSTNNNKTKELLLREEAVVKVKDLLGPEFDDNKAKQILKIAGNDIDVVIEKWNIVQSMDNVKDVAKLLYVAIRDDYKPSAGSNKVSGFGNYKQTEYDLDDIERKLLGLD